MYEIERILRLNNDIVSKALTLLAIEPLLNNLSYRNKTEVMEGYKDSKPRLVDVLKRVNTYRIKFAHPKGIKLRQEFNYHTSKGKQNIRDLLRCLVKADIEMNKYIGNVIATKNQHS